MRGLQKLIGEKEDSGARVDRKAAPDVALVGMGGTVASFCLFLGAFYEVGHDGSNTVLISIYLAFALLLSVLCWYMASLRHRLYKEKAELRKAKRILIKFKTEKDKGNKKVSGSKEMIKEVKQTTQEFSIPAEMPLPRVVPPSDDDIIMGFIYD